MASREEIAAAARRLLNSNIAVAGCDLDCVLLCARVALEAATVRAVGYLPHGTSVEDGVLETVEAVEEPQCHELIRRPTGEGGESG